MQRTMPAPHGARGRVVLGFLVAPLPLLSGVVPVSAEAGTTYYVVAAAGSDDATGRSPTAAWRSLGRVNATTFRPGDRILLRAGRSWQGQLWPKGSRLNQALPLQVAADSPAVNAGLAVPDSGGVDYTGRRVDGRPDIGAFEHRPRT